MVRCKMASRKRVGDADHPSLLAPPRPPAAPASAPTMQATPAAAPTDEVRAPVKKEKEPSQIEKIHASESACVHSVREATIATYCACAAMVDEIARVPILAEMWRRFRPFESRILYHLKLRGLPTDGDRDG